jgi:hypothetical protein
MRQGMLWARENLLLSLLAICGVSHRRGYFDIVMAGIVSAVVALLAVILLGSFLGSF